MARCVIERNERHRKGQSGILAIRPARHQIWVRTGAVRVLSGRRCPHPTPADHMVGEQEK